MLKSMEYMFSSVPDYVIYFYSQFQPVFEDMRKDTFRLSRDNLAPSSSFETAPLPEQWGQGREDSTGGKSKELDSSSSHEDAANGPDGPHEHTGQCENPQPPRPIVNEWVNMLPTTEMLKEKTAPFTDGNGSLVIIDDFAQQLDDSIA